MASQESTEAFPKKRFTIQGTHDINYQCMNEPSCERKTNH